MDANEQSPPSQSPPSRSDGAGARGLSSAATSALAGLGLVALFVGERVIGAGSARAVLDALGVLLLASSLVARAVRLGTAHDGARPVERIALALAALSALAVLLYFVGSDVAAPLFSGKPLAASHAQTSAALAALWPALLAIALLPLFLVEMAYGSMARAPRVEGGRVADAALSGLGIGFTLVAAFALTYVASERDVKVDLSYFRTTKPGEATRRLVRALDGDVQIVSFFPPASEVREEVRRYLDDLARESPRLTVASYDQAVDPLKAKELGVTGNGMVVVARGARHEQLAIDPDLEKARSQLKELDKNVQKRLLAVARPARNVYLTVGHGERLADAANDTDKRPTIRTLRQLLLDQHYSLRDLGPAEGLGTDVPKDAAAVMIIGPTKPFLPEETAAIGRFVDGGGRLFVALDPDTGLEQAGLLAPLGLVFTPVTLANEQFYLRVTYQPSDRANLVTNSFSSHPSVSTLPRLRAPLLFMGAGALSEVKPRAPNLKGLSIDFVAHALPSTWNDKDGDFEFEPKDGEQKKAWELAAAVVRKKEGAPAAGAKPGEGEARALVVGDSDAVADTVINTLGNAYFVLDSMKWLLGDEALVGETQSESDVPIAHTKAQDAAWFYSTIFAAPALVLCAGLVATRRRKRRPRGADKRASAAASTGEQA